MFKNEKGFTLLELVIVIGILGVISAIAMPAISGRGQGAKVAAHQSNLNALANAIESYQRNYDLKAADFHVALDDTHPIVDKGFLRSIPRNPWFDSDTFDPAATPTNTYEYKYMLDYRVLTEGLEETIVPIARLANADNTGTIDSTDTFEIIVNDLNQKEVVAYTMGSGGTF